MLPPPQQHWSGRYTRRELSIMSSNKPSDTAYLGYLGDILRVSWKINSFVTVNKVSAEHATRLPLITCHFVKSVKSLTFFFLLLFLQHNPLNHQSPHPIPVRAWLGQGLGLGPGPGEKKKSLHWLKIAQGALMAHCLTILVHPP